MPPFCICANAHPVVNPFQQPMKILNILKTHLLDVVELVVVAAMLIEVELVGESVRLRSLWLSNLSSLSPYLIAINNGPD